jgi:glyoxylase-like metal-dependent hydrolase (beta-lactamase superfamily II)
LVKTDTGRHPANAEGDWYIDRRCIDCGASPGVAPGLILRRDGQSVFDHQPATEAETEAAWRAMLVCPTASVRRESGGSPPAGLYPEEFSPGVYRCGYNARSSYGAHSYLVLRPEGNVLIDAPRWTRHVADFVRERGGLRHILLTHRDDVADAHKYAQSFEADVWIHERDADAAPYATRLLRGDAVVEPAPGWRAIPVPGHTAGSTAFLLEGTHLFTGDSLAWSPGKRRLTAFRDACWYSWPDQTRSLGRLLDFDFEWVLAGHGGSIRLPPERMRAELKLLLRWMTAAA